MKLKKKSHCVYQCDYHIVLTSKYRRKIFKEGVFAYIKLRLKDVSEHYPELELKELNIDSDHIHFLLSIPPSMPVGKVVGIIKANTSKGIKKKFAFLRDVYWGSDGIWSDGYFVSTVGVNESVIRRYIEYQGKQDTGQAQLELM